MIQQSITLYEEPPWQAQSYQSSYSHTPYAHMTQQQKEMWDTEVGIARAKAKNTFKIGDKVNLKHGTQIIITGFVEDNADVIRAQGEPCIIYAVCPVWVNARPVRYAFIELALDTHVPAEPIINITSVEDDPTHEIPN